MSLYCKRFKFIVYMKVLCLFMFFMLSQLWVKSQNLDKIKVITVDQSETDLVVKFEILDANSANKYDFTLKLIDSTTFKILLPTQITGDINNVIGGGIRTIRVPFSANGLDSKNKYSVLFLNVSQHTILVNNNAILKSIFVPGLGNKNLYKNGGVIATGIAVVSYGCIAYGIYNKIQANNSYNSYKDAYLQNDIDKHFSDAESGQTQFMVFTGIGLGIWALDVLHVALKVKSDKKTRTATNNNSSFKVGYVPPVFNNPNNISQFSITYNF